MNDHFNALSMAYPSYCCQRCGEMIGWLGRIMPFHKCKEKNESLSAWKNPR